MDLFLKWVTVKKYKNISSHEEGIIFCNGIPWSPPFRL